MSQPFLCLLMGNLWFQISGADEAVEGRNMCWYGTKAPPSVQPPPAQLPTKDEII